MATPQPDYRHDSGARPTGDDARSQSLFEYLHRVVTHWGMLGKSLTLLAGVLILLVLSGIGVSEYYLRRVVNYANTRVQFNQQGATIWITGKERAKATFLLPASAGWADTGINVPANSKVRISASGRVLLAAQHMIDAARDDTHLSFGWSEPEGIDSSNPRPSDLARSSMRLMPNAGMGALIGVLRVEPEEMPSITHHQRPNGMFLIGKNVEKQNGLGKDATLWLAVNDIVLDPHDLDASRHAYVGPPIEGFEGLKVGNDGKPLRHQQFDYLRKKTRPGDDYVAERKRRINHFDNYIVPTRYWGIWYDDNIGDYLVQIEIVPGDE